MVDLIDNHEYESDEFSQLDFSGVKLSSIQFNACVFEKCDFSDVIFERCHFEDCTFRHCNLSNVRINYSKFVDVCFRDSKLIGINWTRVAWSQLVFSAPVKFYNSILNDCSFHGLSLPQLIMNSCKVQHVDFRDGDFTDSDFSGSDFGGALFSNTNLTGANFSKATNYDINIYQNTIKNAKFCRFEATRLLDCLEIDLID